MSLASGWTVRVGIKLMETHSDGVYPHSELTHTIIGCAYEVHKELGPGFLEKVYETALLHELSRAGLKAQAQAPIPVRYKGIPVGDYFADLLVEGVVIVELKAAQSLDPTHEAQLLHYLKAAGVEVGLLLNFGRSSVQVKRMVRTNSNRNNLHQRKSAPICG